jgi:holo-[acyl-carrier protein] synthase
VEVLHENSGKPVVATHGNAKKILENIGAKNIFLSISHEKDNAVAIVILED